MHDPQLVDLVKTYNSQGGSYHRIDLGGGFVLEGEYDMKTYLRHYRIPEDLHGVTVLDVGTATGFFALECARRGAEVTAIDLWAEGPLPGLARGLGLEVRYVQMSLYDLTPTLGRFDLVICGSVLLHLWDQFGALRAMRSVCSRQLILATDIMPASILDRGRPLAELVADRAEGGLGEYWTTWRLNVAALRKLLAAAGFSRTEHMGDFRLTSVPAGHGFDVLHGVVHAWV